jgi:hypothetical protein
MGTTIHREGIVPPLLNECETEMIKEAELMIMSCLGHTRAATITIECDNASTPSVQVPAQILSVIGQMLGLMSRHQPITLFPKKKS